MALMDGLYCDKESFEDKGFNGSSVADDDEGGSQSQIHGQNSIKEQFLPFILFEDDFFWEDGELETFLSKEKETHLELDSETLDGSLLASRKEAVEWVLRVKAHYGFTALTVALAVNYFNRFVSSLGFQKDKPWMGQLATVACLSLATKVEETYVPLLLDLQVEESKYVFEANTIKRMELLVLSTLQWRMNPVSGVGRESVGFTAAPFFIIGGIWFIFFGLCLSFICLCFCCCRREPYGYSRACYAASLIFLILFTVAAIAGCVVLYTGEGKFHSITTNTLDYVVSQANVTTENLRNVSGYLAAAKNVSLNSAMLSPSVQNGIDNIDAKINSSASTLSTRTQKNSKDIDDALDIMGLSLVILAAVMLALAFIGFLCSIFGLQCLVYFLVVRGWILLAGTFILCGVFLLIHNVVGDTCIAMDEWVQNPTAKTALDDIIPCVDNTTAQETLTQTKSVTYELVKELDGVISNLSNRNFPPVAVPLYYNQSGPLVPLVCNPFNADYSTRHCAAGEVDLGNAIQVLMNYTCQVSSSGICTTTGRLTPSMYSQMAAAVNISYGLYRYGPFLVELEDCTFVRQTFTEISSSYCPKLRRYTEWIYIGLVIVSAAVMLSLVFWVIYARERRHRVYTKQHDGMMQRNDPDKDY